MADERIVGRIEASVKSTRKEKKGIRTQTIVARNREQTQHDEDWGCEKLQKQNENIGKVEKEILFYVSYVFGTTANEMKNFFEIHFIPFRWAVFGAENFYLIVLRRAEGREESRDVLQKGVDFEKEKKKIFTKINKTRKSFSNRIAIVEKSFRSFSSSTLQVSSFSSLDVKFFFSFHIWSDSGSQLNYFSRASS